MRDCIRAGRGDDGVADATPEEIHNAAQECRAERTLDSEGFATTYGTNANDRNAFGKCVSTKVRAEAETPEGALGLTPDAWSRARSNHRGPSPV